MFEELQQQLVALLVAGLPGEAIYGAVPQDAAVPRIVVGEVEADNADTDSSLGKLTRTRVRIIRKAGDMAGSVEMADRVLDLLHHTEALTLTTGDVVTVYCDGPVSDAPGDEGKTRETEVSVFVLVDDITSGTA